MELNVENGKMALILEILDVKYVHDVEVLKSINVECHTLLTSTCDTDFENDMSGCV